MWSRPEIASRVAPVGVTLVLQLFLLPGLQAQWPEPTAVGIELGAVGGFEFTEGVDELRVGLRGHADYGRIGVTTTFVRVLTTLPPEWTGGAWQLYLTGDIRPFGPDSWLTLGYGLTIEHRWARWDFLGRTDPISSGTNATDAATIEVAAPFGRLRPFANLYVTRLLDRDGQVGGHALLGLVVDIL